MKEAKEEIKKWLNSMGIDKYTINDDLTVDVDGDVYIIRKQLFGIPIQFGKVSGNFVCSYNYFVTLKGSPEYVGGNFDCSANNIISLKGRPKYIDGEFCSFWNDLDYNYLESIDFNFVKGEIKTDFIGINNKWNNK